MRNGALASYDSEHLSAVDDAEAIRKATAWRVTAAATIDERTWLPVLLEMARHSIQKNLECLDTAIASGRILISARG
jgi:hypothetical protein